MRLPTLQSSISIIIPVYNVEPYLPQCLESLIHQTLRDIEIICVDDGSTDASLTILADYAARDERIRVLTQPNAGQGAARNRALEIARAPYIMFCDSDDWYEPTMCERMHAAIHESGADFARCGVQMHYESDAYMVDTDERYFRIEQEGLVPLNERVVERLDVSPCNKIYRRSRLQEWEIQFPEGLKYEDVYFSSIYMLRSEHAYFINERLYHYLRRRGSTMSTSFSGNAAYYAHPVAIAKLLYHYLQMHRLLPAWQHLFAKVFLSHVDMALGYTSSPQAKEAILDDVQEFIRGEALDFSSFSDLAYANYRITHRKPIGHVEKRLGGLLRIVQKPTCAKYYLCGIGIYRTRAI